MKRLFAASILLCANVAQAGPVEALIDKLQTVDASVPGIDGSGTYAAFLAEDAPPKFSGGLLPAQGATVHPAMRELVRLGTAALPALLAHLDDARPTRLTVATEVSPVETFGGQFFADEYDPRDPKQNGPDCTSNFDCRSFDHPYRVNVGDVCEVLIGQIVNRHLRAVRYQPTAIVYVNSPIETPALAARIREDWSGTSAKDLEASLLSDLRATDELDAWRGYRGALRRLRFYFPQSYAALTGADLDKRKAFEASP